ncbi:hypothetical protein [Burkholderia thailandensis]|uniref:hypothetical protein n=1 Tax=Burkholderia thailandensis TaxID=57975 RepID=UPI0003EC6B3D|nr:hypothetical protein [Burkholderia thailandensis]AHI65987.1 hypothetical protein BTL_1313 [Burkholderia thailandensis H0587]AOJ50284.1 hypothetical protein AQ475_05135 [Burkholderia thailandensis]AVR25694.1 hypothetical protein A8H32_11720 [Burkholderia thailandensis]
MADIRLIEAQLAEARQQTAIAQQQLEDRLLENNGAEDEETASLRSAADLHRSREASLVRVHVAAQRANTAAAIEARHQESRDGVRAARALERRYVNAAKALEAALEAVAVARSEFLQVDSELHAVIRTVCMNPELSDAHTSGLLQMNAVRAWISDQAVRTYVRSMFDEEHRPDSLAGTAAKHMQQTITRLETAAAFRKPTHQPSYIIDSESALRSASEAGKGA